VSELVRDDVQRRCVGAGELGGADRVGETSLDSDRAGTSVSTPGQSGSSRFVVNAAGRLRTRGRPSS